MLRPTDGQRLAAACALERRFETPASCTWCGRVFGAEVIWRRVFELGLGFAVTVFCDRCNAAVPRGGPVELELRARLERQALASVPPQGRA
jgi:hypothetical protein